MTESTSRNLTTVVGRALLPVSSQATGRSARPTLQTLILACCVLPFLALPVLTCAAEGNPPTESPPAVDYMILVTGGELLAGVYADAHTQFLARTLRPLGLHCIVSVTADDKATDIQAALGFAKGKARLVIVTGGLGPTDNDITREALEAYTGIPLHEQPDLLQEMERRFQVTRDQLRSNLRRQTRIPTRGTYLKSSFGTAAGLVFEHDDFVVVALPGPPRELQPMVRDELIPYLTKRFGTRPPGCSVMLRFVGLGQSQIDHTIDQHMALDTDITVSSLFEAGRVDFIFGLPNDTPQDRVRLQELKRQILEHLSDSVYAEDETTLEQCVAKLLATRGTTLALAEVGSAGAITAGLDGVNGADRILIGAFVAPTEERMRQLLRVPDDAWQPNAPSDQRAKLLADRVAEKAGGGWVIVVGQPLTDDKGTSFVEVAVRPPSGETETLRHALRGTGEISRDNLTTQILDQLRRRLR